MYVASFPPTIKENPYQRLLYDHLLPHGFAPAPPARLRLRWLWESRRHVKALHFHWPQAYYRHETGAPSLRRALSWVRLGLFGARLAVARTLGYRIAWTVHELYPHERFGRRLDHAAATMLARASHDLNAHDRITLNRVD
jgi:hypothetical protein